MKVMAVNKTDVEKLFEDLKKEGRMYGLAYEDDRWLFKAVDELSDPGADYKPTVIPPKKYFFPQIESLVKYRRDGWGENSLVFSEDKIVIWGVRPCDIHAINLLDKIFAADNQDSHYLTRRKNSIIVGVTCQCPCDDRCFCYDIGTLDVESGFDLLLTDLGESYAVAVGTDRAKFAAKRAGIFRELNKDENRKLESLRSDRDKVFKKRLKVNVNDLPLLFKSSDNHPSWEEMGKKDLGCGSCNLVCPTCYCFDVVDRNDVNLQGGERVRRWDGCMLKDFSLVAGGEVFRKTKAARLRHRWHRKFDYLMTKYGQSNCVGCGRCGRACLVNINPIDIVNNLSEHN